MHIRDINEDMGMTLSDFGYRRDNPGKDDCLRKRKAVEEASVEAGGPREEGMAAKLCTGWATAHMGIFKPMFLPVKILINLEGANNEHFHRNPGESKYDRLADTVSSEGWRDIHPLMIRINHLGTAIVVEGNTRLRVAHANGVEYIAVQIEWMNGVEEEAGEWSPRMLAQLAVTNPPLQEGVNFYHQDDPFAPRPMEGERVLYRSVSLHELEHIFSIGKIMGGQNKFNDFEHRRWVFFGDEITPQLIQQGEEIERQAVHSLSDHGVHAQFREMKERNQELVRAMLKRMRALGIDYDDTDADHFMNMDSLHDFHDLVRHNNTIPVEDRKYFRDSFVVLFGAGKEMDVMRKEFQGAIRDKKKELRDFLDSARATSAIIVTRPLGDGLHYSKDFGKSGFQTSEFGFYPGQVTVEDIEKVIFVRKGKRIGTAQPGNVLAVVRKILNIS